VDGWHGTVTSPLDSSTLELRSVKLDDMRDGYEFTADERGWHRVSMDLVIWHRDTLPLHVGS
jgi:hypothetical protein